MGNLIRTSWLLILLLGILSGGCGKDDPTGLIPEGNKDLVGTWDLVTVDGQPLFAGVSLRWVFTPTTLSWSSDLDCSEVIEYRTEGNELHGVRLISQTGTQCGDDEEDTAGFFGTFSVTATRLTVTVTDPDLTPPTVDFVFQRVN